jgi:GNAT superfamily N-acetyltransferase
MTNETIAYIGFLGLDQRHQQQGLGTALLEVLETKAKQLGAHSIYLCRGLQE